MLRKGLENRVKGNSISSPDDGNKSGIWGKWGYKSKMPAFSLEGSRVRLLVRELRSHTPRGAAKKLKKKKKL